MFFRGGVLGSKKEKRKVSLEIKLGIRLYFINSMRARMLKHKTENETTVPQTTCLETVRTSISPPITVNESMDINIGPQRTQNIWLYEVDLPPTFSFLCVERNLLSECDKINLQSWNQWIQGSWLSVIFYFLFETVSSFPNFLCFMPIADVVSTLPDPIKLSLQESHLSKRKVFFAT